MSNAVPSDANFAMSPDIPEVQRVELAYVASPIKRQRSTKSERDLLRSLIESIGGSAP